MRQLNHYDILEPIGHGGMGDVYLAEDTKLHRKVAIKVLSGLSAADPERRQRFEREARAIAALNHPSIVTIHSVEESDGVPFLTMELVEGRPLTDVIPGGGLPLDALLRVAIGVSDAMAAAHQRGITHRDLKPANVMVTNDGRVKVLDFGLAKLREADLDANDATRLPPFDLTGEGRIIGTVAYMSPEQAEGKTVDQRSDIFSLGVMLHEMATGEKPFKGGTNLSVLSAILKDTPSSITEINARLPSGLAKIIRRSLAKDPSRRYQTATDLRNELEELKQEIDTGVRLAMPALRPLEPARPASARFGRVTRVALPLGLAALAVAAYGVYRWRGASVSTPFVNFEIGRFTRLTNSGNAAIAAVSGDGRYVVHVKDGGLWVRQTATMSDVQIVTPSPVRYDGLTFSPDGNYVFYVTYELTGGIGTLYKIPVLGGTPQRLVDDIDSRVTFSPDARRFAFVRGVITLGRRYIMVANADGSGVTELAAVEPPDRFQTSAPAWSADGKTILVAAESRRDGPHNLAYAVDVETRTLRAIGGRWAFLNDLDWLPDSRSFIVSAVDFGGQSPQLWQVQFPGGERHRVTNDLNNYLGVSVSSDGRSIATIQAESVSNIWVAPADNPSAGMAVTTGRGRGDGLSGLSWTPDGRIVFSSAASGQPQIWITDADGKNQRQLTNDQAPAFSPSVTPDGRFIVFQKAKAEGMFIARMNLDGGNLIQLSSLGTEFTPTTSRDSRWVFFNSPSSGRPRPHKVSIDGGGTVLIGEVFFRTLAVSPDGALLLGASWDETNRRPTLATLPVGGGVVTPLGLPALGSAAWTPDGKSVTYLMADDVLTLFTRELAGGAPRQLTTIRGEHVRAFAWAPDGKRLALARGAGFSDVMLITAKDRP